ncbi:hypothetical protein QZH41_010884, partial [Actinostola sp. cb2023]
ICKACRINHASKIREQGTENTQVEQIELTIPGTGTYVEESRGINMTEALNQHEHLDAIHDTTNSDAEVCAASKKKSLAGLDSNTADGVSAIQSLENVTESLRKFGLTDDMVKNMESQLRSSKAYLKTDCKVHVPYSYHIYSGTQYSERLEEIQYELNSAVPLIEDWKAHVLRAMHQASAKIDLFDSLTSNQVVVIMDWAMNFLPSSFRETQKDWFGKRGKSWHVSVTITKQNDGELETKSFVHVFEQCTQNWFAVISIIEHTLTTIHKNNPAFNEAFLRSDNAGCYHCGFLALSLPSLGQRTGVTMRRYDFSDPQAGKDVCDRRIAVLKSHIRRYVNEGYNVHTAADMKTAMDSYGGVKGCYVAVVATNEKCQTMTKHSLTGIQTFNNLLFESSGLRVWKAYNIGPGKYFTASQLEKMGEPQRATKLTVLQDFSDPEHEVGRVSRKLQPAKAGEPVVEEEDEVVEENTDSKGDALFSCPEVGCVKTYLSHRSLQNHLGGGHSKDTRADPTGN